MLSKFEQLRKQKNEAFKGVNENIEQLRTIAEESKRIANIAKNAESILDKIDIQFSEITRLNKTDISFLFLATALQCIRQYWLTNEKFRFKNDGDSSKLLKRKMPKSYSEILLSPVPYDAFKKTERFNVNTGISGRNHRYTVLGHDPLFGWIFGPINIVTDSLTKNNWNLESFRVMNSTHLDSQVHFSTISNECCEYVKDDYKLLIVSVIRHAIHLGTDAFTKMGLPVPLINQISPDLTSKLLDNGIDMYSTSRSMMLSSLINKIIAVIHGLFYDPLTFESRDLYEVKTRKILSYSNVIASSSNVIYVAISSYLGNSGALKSFDLGGLLVTLYRLVTDYHFIKKVKQEFIEKEFYHLVIGNDYHF